jgi:transposase
MLYAGLDLSRKRLEFRLLDEAGETLEVGAAAPDADGLRGLARRIARFQEPVRAAIESMNGARCVHDQLELAGWRVEIADAVKVRGLAPLACKTDRIDAWVLAELSRRDLVPAIWLPDPRVRGERERARFWLHLVRHRSSLKQRVHAVLLAHGRPCPVSDLFGVRGRALLERLALPEPWAGTVQASLRLIDELEREIAACEAELRQEGADHRYVPLLLSVPGIGWVLAYTIAAEIGDIARFPSSTKLAGYTGLCPRVYQSARPTAAARSPSRGRSTCAGRLSRPPSTPADTPTTASATSARRRASAASAAPGSPRSISLAGSPRPSGTSSLATVPSLRQAPPSPWPRDGPLGNAPPERASHPPSPPRGGDREMSATRGPNPDHPP